MLLSSSLSDQLATVALVKRRLLYATVVALSISVLLGFMVAAIHARRLGRLQTAADRIAEGAFEEPVVDDRRRGRAARGVVRPDADPARAARPGTKGVRRERLARAADAALLARRLPGAPRRRGPRRAHASRVPGHDAESGRPPDEARERPARPLPPRRGADPDRAGRGRPRRGGTGRRRGLLRARRCLAPHAAARGRRRRLGACGRGARAADRARARRQLARAHAGRDDGELAGRAPRAPASRSSSRTTAPGSRPSTWSRSSSASTASRAGRPRAAASGWRSRASSRG